MCTPRCIPTRPFMYLYALLNSTMPYNTQKALAYKNNHFLYSWFCNLEIWAGLVSHGDILLVSLGVTYMAAVIRRSDGAPRANMAPTSDSWYWQSSWALFLHGLSSPKSQAWLLCMVVSGQQVGKSRRYKAYWTLDLELYQRQFSCMLLVKASHKGNSDGRNAK